MPTDTTPRDWLINATPAPKPTRRRQPRPAWRDRGVTLDEHRAWEGPVDPPPVPDVDRSGYSWSWRPKPRRDEQ